MHLVGRGFGYASCGIDVEMMWECWGINVGTMGECCRIDVRIAVGMLWEIVAWMESDCKMECGCNVRK